MAAASEKARFFLEQSVPELREYERKKIFTRDEISRISRQRSDFEHKINARGSTPSDYARYAEFETNVESLRKKRIKRLGIKATNHNGQRRIFFVFDRGTKKHPGDVGLWLQYIEFAKSCRANKKLAHIFANVLRLHPARPELWIYAAQHAMEENGDMTEARGYMQRGLRFCKNKQTLWLQYLRLEMSYLAKLQARRQILGIQTPREESRTGSETGVDLNDPVIVDAQPVEGVVSTVTATNPTSVVAGAVPIAIFDSAVQQFGNDPKLVSAMLNLIFEYGQLTAAMNVLRHIHNSCGQSEDLGWASQASEILLSVCGCTVTSPEFPAAFRVAVKNLKSTSRTPEFRLWAKSWLEALAAEEELDPALAKVASSVGKSLDAN